MKPVPPGAPIRAAITRLPHAKDLPLPFYATDQSAGMAALEAWTRGGRFADWKSALSTVPERGAITVAQQSGLFQAVGMR